MSKKVSPEARVIVFFETASLEVAEALLNVAKAVVKARQEADGPPKPVVRQRNRKQKEMFPPEATQ